MSMRSRGIFHALACAFILTGGVAHGAEWAQHSGDLKNSRYQSAETSISPASVAGLGVKWFVATPGDVTSTPTLSDGKVYFGDWAGNVYRVDAATGAVDWSVSLPAITGFAGDLTRSGVSVVGRYVILGNQSGRTGQGGAKLIALDKATGNVGWVTQLDPYPFTFVTTAPTVFKNVAYVGVASFEEGFAAFFPASVLPCCYSRGSVVAVDVNTGAIKWQTYTVPEFGPDSGPPPDGAGRFSGNGVWGSAPAIDVKRNQLYVGTGNNYSAPVSYHQCIEAAETPEAQLACNVAGNYFDSVLALDLTTGAVNWSKLALPFDTWNVACALFLIPDGFPFPTFGQNCAYDNAYGYGPDYDFAQAPILYQQRGKDYVGAGQKSGVYWALDPDSGAKIWSTQTGPGGLAGGHQWGSASDGSRIYTSNANSLSMPWSLPNGSLTYAGVFSALDSRTGSLLWQIPNPAATPAGAPATVANGVVFVCSGEGTFFGLSAATGAVKWSFASGAACGASGASVLDGTVYWGTGYAQGLGGPAVGTPGVYAFSLP